MLLIRASTTWPIVSLKHDDMAASFLSRMTRDQCSPSLAFTTSGSTITAVTLTTTGNVCGAKIPVTVPGTVTNTQGFTTEKLGSDPLTSKYKPVDNGVDVVLISP